jgi:putative methyltransferase
MKVIKKTMADMGETIPKALIKSPVSKCTMIVMLYDVCVAKQRITCGGPIKKFISEHKVQILELYEKNSAEIGTTEKQKQFQLKVSPFTYCRINLLKCTRDGILAKLQSDEYRFKMVKTLDEVSSDANAFFCDDLIENLLVFNSRQKRLFGLDIVTETFELVIQDKASCFSAAALAPQPGWTVIDACSAPGNKTSHLASLMGGSGKIFAFEKDKRRFGILTDRMKQLGATNVQSLHQDFLKVNPFDSRFSNLKAILVDPTCSGSGIDSKNKFETIMHEDDADEEKDAQQKKQEAKIRKLADFQVKVVVHALSFPSVSRVVYSTCSVNIEENEDVVDRVLKQNDEFEVVRILPNWPRRGSLYSAFADKCVRCSPEEDGTHGFFVCAFERKAVL